MVDLTVTLPDVAINFIQEQVNAGHYASASEYITELIENARPVIASDSVAQLIQEGMESGPGVEVTEAYWEGLSERVPRLNGDGLRNEKADRAGSFGV